MKPKISKKSRFNLPSKLEPTNKRSEFYYALDKKINRRVVHILKDGYLISLVTGTKIKFKEEKGK